ncbi:hypothetical protein D6833_01170, partial [Candidatus Parcubacteria bacterium]
RFFRYQKGNPPFSLTMNAAVAYRENHKLILLLAEPDGKPLAVDIDAEGKYRGPTAPVRLEFKQAVRDCTSFALAAPDQLITTTTGALVILRKNGHHWREERRIAQLGQQKLRGPLFIHSHGKYLWVTVRDRHLVICCDLKTFLPLATFGEPGEPGTDLTHLHAPTSIAAWGERAAVYDAGNQRILKLQLKP